jgi:hypothetical protein
MSSNTSRRTLIVSAATFPVLVVPAATVAAIDPADKVVQIAEQMLAEYDHLERPAGTSKMRIGRLTTPCTNNYGRLRHSPSTA